MPGAGNVRPRAARLSRSAIRRLRRSADRQLKQSARGRRVLASVRRMMYGYHGAPVIRTHNLTGAPTETRTHGWGAVLDRRRLQRALQRLSPTFALPHTGVYGAGYQIAMWEPYLRAAGVPYLIVVIDDRAAEVVSRVSDAPVVVLPAVDDHDLKLVFGTSVRAAFYVKNSRLNTPFMEQRITHVWLGHGDSDKPASFVRRHARYDRVAVCGQAGIDRYAEHGVAIPPERFVVLGRPQSEKVARGREGAPIHTVLYAPTWRGIAVASNADFSSLALGPELVGALLERGVTVVFRPHPFSRRTLADRAAIARIHELLVADHARTGRPHVFGDQAEQGWSLVDCLNHADALVSDVSAVVTDFLASGKPFAMVAMSADRSAFRDRFPIAQAAYVIEADLKGLAQVLDELLHGDPLAGERARRRTYYLGEFEGDEASRAVADFVREVVGRGPAGRSAGSDRPLSLSKG